MTSTGASLTDRRLTMAALGSYLLLVPLYRNLHTLVLLILHRGQAEVLANLPDWALLFRLLQPSEAFYRLLRLGFDVEPASRYLGPDAPLPPQPTTLINILNPTS